MLTDAKRASFGYDEWATTKIFDAANGLTAEQFDARSPIPYGSIRATLLHALLNYRRYLSWWDGSFSAQDVLALTADPADYPDLASLRGPWEQIATQTRTFVTALSAEDMARIYSTSGPDGSELSVPLWQIMQHVSNHNTQHRGEIAVMLTEAGCSPGDVDVLFYQIEALANA